MRSNHLIHQIVETTSGQGGLESEATNEERNVTHSHSFTAPRCFRIDQAWKGASEQALKDLMFFSSFCHTLHKDT